MLAEMLRPAPVSTKLKMLGVVLLLPMYPSPPLKRSFLVMVWLRRELTLSLLLMVVMAAW